MRRLFTVCLFAAIGMIAVDAQQTPSGTPLPPAMQSAIHRLIEGTPNPPPIQLHNPPPAGVCSVPLAEMRVQHPKRFPIGTAPAPNTADAMPSTQGLAPGCDATKPAARP